MDKIAWRKLSHFSSIKPTATEFFRIFSAYDKKIFFADLDLVISFNLRGFDYIDLLMQ